MKVGIRITSGIVKRSNEYEHHIKFLGTSLGEIRESGALCKDNKKKEKLLRIGEIITEIISESNNQIDLRDSRISGQDNAGTSSPSSGVGSRASSSVLSEKSPTSSPISSRRDSISATLSSVKEYNNLQKRNEDQT